MPRKALTHRFVESLKSSPPAKQIDYWDTSLKGFSLRHSPGGARTWTFCYRRGRTQRRLKLGSLPETRLADARDLAENARHEVHLGNDPAADRRHAETFGDLAKLYLEGRSVKKRKDGSIREDSLEHRGVFPKRIQVSVNVVAWLEDDVAAWIQSRVDHVGV